MSKNKSNKEKTMEQVQAEALDLIMQGAEILGWQVALPGEDEIIDGVILGTEEFVKNVVGDDYEVYDNFGDKGDPGELH